MIRAHAAHQALRRPRRRRRHRLRRRARPGHRLPRPERRRQVHDHADDPRPGRPDVRDGQRQRPPVRRVPGAAARDRRPPRRARHPPRAVRSRPPAVDGGVQRHPDHPGRRGARAGRPRLGRRPAGRAGSRSAWASGSASPPRCSATRRSSCSTSRSTGSTPRASAGCAAFARQLADEGRTVFISSHLMSEMALMADHLIVIGRGQILADCSMNDFMADHASSYVRVKAPALTDVESLLVGRDLDVQRVDGELRVAGLDAPADRRPAARRRPGAARADPGPRLARGRLHDPDRRQRRVPRQPPPLRRQQHSLWKEQPDDRHRTPSGPTPKPRRRRPGRARASGTR